jgi:hypothetical protein
MTIVQDTRQQAHKDDHVLLWFKMQGINVVRSKLYAGDYALLTDMSVVVERKKDMLEIANCICGNSHERFRNEIIRCKENNIKLYILIEDEYIYNINGVKYYQCPRYKSNQYKVIDGKKVLVHRKGEKHSQVNFETLGKAMKTMEEKYGCTFVFAKRVDFGKKVVELLTTNRKELE